MISFLFRSSHLQLSQLIYLRFIYLFPVFSSYSECMCTMCSNKNYFVSVSLGKYHYIFRVSNSLEMFTNSLTQGQTEGGGGIKDE
jgi:hypothetical protein